MKSKLNIYEMQYLFVSILGADLSLKGESSALNTGTKLDELQCLFDKKGNKLQLAKLSFM